MSENDSSIPPIERNFREGQRVCRVEWCNGHPFLKFATVTKVTKSTYYVDGKRGRGWQASGRHAIDQEYLDLFRDWDIFIGSKIRPKDWTIRDTVCCVCRVRRMERRLLRRKRI